MNKAACCFLLLCCFIFFSCTSSKKITASSKEKITVDDILKEIEKNKHDFEWMAAKMRIAYKDEKQTRNFTANLRLQKDNVIWISVTTILGIEAARVMIKNDSVYFLNRLQKQYKESSLSLLEDYLPFPFDVKLLQNILVGNPILTPNAQTKLKEEDNQIHLISEYHSIKHTVVLDPANFKISTEHLLDRQTERHVSLIFQDYQNAGDRLFSYSRNISFRGEHEIDVTLDFSKLKWNEPQEFPFHVPEKYD